MTLNSSTPWAKSLALVAAVLALGACTAISGVIDSPIQRKFQWFSFLEGGDFKETCGPNAPARYRMVYNAVYTEQVRVYDLDPAAGVLDAHVIVPENIAAFEIEGIGDLSSPWRGKAATTKLSADDADGLVRDLETFGAFGAPNVGAELSSKGFFWTIAACHEGQYHFTGFAWPGAAWEQATFATRLFALDQTGVAVNNARRTSLMLTHPSKRGKPGHPTVEFRVKVGADGMAGHEPLF